MADQREQTPFMERLKGEIMQTIHSDTCPHAHGGSCPPGSEQPKVKVKAQWRRPWWRRWLRLRRG